MSQQVTTYSFVMILVIAAVTYLTRVAPFVLFSNHKEPPQIVLYLGRVLPPAVMTMLVVYCLKAVQPLTFPFGLPEVLSCGLIVLLHVWRRNMLLSIFGGTAVYMFLVQVLFV